MAAEPSTRQKCTKPVNSVAVHPGNAPGVAGTAKVARAQHRRQRRPQRRTGGLMSGSGLPRSGVVGALRRGGRAGLELLEEIDGAAQVRNDDGAAVHEADAEDLEQFFAAD